MPRTCKTAAVLCLVFLASAPALAGDLVDVFDEAWEVVGRDFYDKDHHGLDWDGVRETFRPRAEAAGTSEEVHAVINRMLAELRASHLVLIEKDVYRDHFAPEFTGKPTLRAGIEVSRHGDHWFVSAVLEGSLAAEAGVHKGDGVLEIDGVAPGESTRLVDAGSDPGLPGAPHYFLRVRKDEPIRLRLRSRDDPAADRQVSFLPSRTSMVRATEASVGTVVSGDRRFGYIHLWHFLSPRIGETYRNAVRKEFAECDGLILDIRGRGGSPFVMNAVLSTLRRHREDLPAVVLIDENSRSAKEVFAHLVRKQRLGIVVGRKTPGAVLGSTFHRLGDGSVLLLPVMDVSGLTGGEQLEGTGVEPDVPVEAPDRYLDGGDPVLEQGIRTLRRELALREAI